MVLQEPPAGRSSQVKETKMTNTDKPGIRPPKGYHYDPELSDTRMAGFCDQSGDQWYAKRTDLAADVKVTRRGRS
jgi:hypothetical protein